MRQLPRGDIIIIINVLIKVMLNVIRCRGTLQSQWSTLTESTSLLEVVRMNTSFGDRSFAAAAPRAWNRLPDVVRNSALSEDAFAKLLKTYLMNCM